jgi:hypothetical protein
VPGREGSSTGLLVVRIWLEDGPESGLRARITRLLDVDSRDETVRVVSGVLEIRREVDGWLSAFLELHGARRT